MNAMAKLKNLTSVRKNLSQISRIVMPGDTVDIPVEKAAPFVNREGWEVTFPPEPEERAEDSPLALYFLAPFGVADGYGNLAEGILLFLDRAGVRVTARHLWQLNPAGLQRRTLELLHAPLKMMTVGLCMATAGEFSRLPTAFKVGITMYESTDYRPRHPQWTWQINEMDLLLTFGCAFGGDDDWNAALLRRCGVRVPIGVVRGSGNWHFYQPEARWSPPREQGEEFVVVTWGAMSRRKAPLEMIDVFKRAFPRRKYPHCRFRIKTVAGILGDGQPGTYRPDDPRVEIISADWLPAQMVEFARGADVMLYLSHGEGIGRPPREAMAMGLPLICADNSGMRPICRPEFMTPIETRHMEPAPIGGEWAVADPDAAVEALRWHYKQREAAREKAEKGARWIARNHSPETQAQDIVRLLETADPAEAKSQQGRAWAADYAPKTDHTPAVEMLCRYVPPPARVLIFGPEAAILHLRQAGYDATRAHGVPLEAPIGGKIRPGRIQDALGQAQAAVVVVPGAHYPIRERGDEWLAELHEWERLLEATPLEIDTSTGTAGFNVAGRGTYGGDTGKDYNLFVVLPGPKVRGIAVR
jgi:glycosyltransferase involved in cell wall biosynthesis